MRINVGVHVAIDYMYTIIISSSSSQLAVDHGTDVLIIVLIISTLIFRSAVCHNAGVEDWRRIRQLFDGHLLRRLVTNR